MIYSLCMYVLASQMWTFATLLPLLIGDLVPDEQPHWECFLILLQIVKQCTSKLISASSSAFIAALVDQHHRSFKKCYPDVMLTPKMHYMVHFPQQLLKYDCMFTYSSTIQSIHIICTCITELAPSLCHGVCNWRPRMRILRRWLESAILTLFCGQTAPKVVMCFTSGNIFFL